MLRRFAGVHTINPRTQELRVEGRQGRPISLTSPNMSSRALAALKCDSKMRNVANYFHGWYALNARKYESPSEASGFGYYLAAGTNPFALGCAHG